MSSQTSSPDAIANPDSVVSGNKYRFTLISDVVLRYEWAEDGVFEDRPSTFVIKRNFLKPKFTFNDEHDKLEIITDSFHLTYDKKKFASDNLVVSFPTKGSWQGGSWRYGTAPQDNLGGTARTLDGANGRINVEPGVLSRSGFSSLDDSKSVLLSKDGFFAPRHSGDGRVDGYLFVYGDDYKAAIKAFYAISGRQPVLPRFALGNWWSRYHSYDANEYLDLMDRFKSNKMPLSVAVIDMGWHLDGWWTGYTWNKALFPDPKAFANQLHDRKLKMTLNEHPHQGVHSFEEKYDVVARYLGRDPGKKETIPFDCADPKYMHALFNILHRNLEDQGCDFWWLDWQQGTTSKMPGLDPLWALNHLQFVDTAKVTKDTEPLMLSRYGGPGSHRYPLQLPNIIQPISNPPKTFIMDFSPPKEPETELGRYRILSSTAGVRVSPLALGAMSLGQSWSQMMGSMDEGQSFKLLDAYTDAGGNFIDTANNYQDEESEKYIGKWMAARGNRDLLFIATKFTNCYRSHEFGTGKTVNYGGNHKKSLRLSVADSLKKLQTDYIDLLYVHWWDCLSIAIMFGWLSNVQL